MEEKASVDEYVSEEDFELENTSDFKAKLEAFLESRYFLASVLVLVALASFFLGRISGATKTREPVRVYNSNNSLPNSSLNLREGSSAPLETQQNSASLISGTSYPSAETVVASKNGTKYHYPWCAGAKQITEKNKITFNSIEEARAKGYTPAANCKGLQ
ncbi:MAG TPA: hypothetical protein VJB58_02770 [Candidatus Paceibacterota bacterium]